MNTDVPDDFDPEEAATEVLAGREPPPFTQAPDWVGLADISPTARHLHTLLCAHVNQKRAGKKLVWPSTRSLAKMLHLSRRDKVGPFIAELVGIKAIDKKRTGMPARNVYVVHSLPPEGYSGPLSVSEWYERNRAALAAEAEADKATRTKRSEAKKSGSKEPQVAPVAPNTGQQAVTPNTGQQDAPQGGQLVTAPAGRKQEEVELDEVEQDSVPTTSVRPGEAPKVAQATIDGAEENLAPKPETDKDVAFGIANGWIGYRSSIGLPVAGTRVDHQLKSLVLPFLVAKYTKDEIKRALNGLGEGIPSRAQMQRALETIRGNSEPGPNGRPVQQYRGGGGAMAGTNRHLDDITAEERQARNPLNNAVYASECTPAPAVTA